jgi:hypothetical protein
MQSCGRGFRELNPFPMLLARCAVQAQTLAPVALPAAARALTAKPSDGYLLNLNFIIEVENPR